MSSLPIAYQRHPLVATAFPRRWLTRHAGRSRTPTALFGFRLATLSFLAYLFCTCFVSSNTVPPASPLRLFLGRHPRSSQPSAFTSSFPPPPPLLTIPSCSIRTNRVPRRPCVALATLDPSHTARICCSRSGTANRASVKVVKLHDWGLGSENRTRVFVQVTGTAVWLGRRKDVSESLIEMERLAGDDLGQRNTAHSYACCWCLTTLVETAYRMNFAIPVWRWEDPALSLFIEERFEVRSPPIPVSI